MTNTSMNNDTPAHEVKLPYDATLLRGKEGKYIQDSAGLAVLDFPALPEALKVVVHNGGFHADELVSVALLEYVTGKRCRITTSRNPADWATGDFVIDVAEGLLDHHGQRFDGVSCGASRVYRLLEQTKGLRDMYEPEWWDLVGEFVDTVAKHDNGIEVSQKFHFVSVLSRIQVVTGEDCFYEALDMVRKYVASQLGLFKEEVRAKKLAEADIMTQKDNDVVVFSEGARAASIKELLWEHKHPAIFYVSAEKADDWRILCCAPPKEQDDEQFDQFASRFLIPEEFRGLRGEELSEKSGIPGGIFCHMKGFVAGFKTVAGATKFANLCINRLKG